MLRFYVLNFLQLTAFLAVLLPNSGKSQTTLYPGDMAFTGIRWSGGDGFEVVTFVDLCPGTVVYFTDNPYRNSSFFCTSSEEFCVSLTVTTKIPAGAKIRYSDGSPGTFTFTAGAGTIAFAFGAQGAGTNNGFSNNQDNCFAFQGSYLFPSFICGIKCNATWTASGSVTCTNRAHTELPNQLTNGVNAVVVNSGSDGAIYNCSTTSNTKANLSAAINNAANWTAINGFTTACAITVTGAVVDPCICLCNIWKEDFNTTRYPGRSTTGANSNTVNGANDWTTGPTDCDDATPYGTSLQSWWGTELGEFRCNDVEGGPCTCSTGGTTLNEFLSESIDISTYIQVSICTMFRTFYGNSTGMEPGGTSCNNADDVIQGQYSINGGAFVTWFFDDDEANISTATVSGLSGNTLVLRYYFGNKANDEHHFLDNICVSGVSVLPIELLDLRAYNQGDHNVVEWTSATETNLQTYEVERSTDGTSFSKMTTVSPIGGNVARDYVVYDTSLQKFNVIYYRLISKDFDGTTQASRVLSVRNAYPVSEEIFVSSKNHAVVISVINKRNYRYEIFAIDGSLIESGYANDNIESARLTTGVYIVVVYVDNIPYSNKVIVN
jgi:hypothetical protein